MAHIFNNLYAVQDEVRLGTGFPDRLLASVIDDQLDRFYHSAKNKGEELDWSTLSISTRFDGLTNALLVSARVNAS